MRTIFRWTTKTIPLKPSEEDNGTVMSDGRIETDPELARMERLDEHNDSEDMS